MHTATLCPMCVCLSFNVDMPNAENYILSNDQFQERRRMNDSNPLLCLFVQLNMWSASHSVRIFHVHVCALSRLFVYWRQNNGHGTVSCCHEWRFYSFIRKSINTRLSRSPIRMPYSSFPVRVFWLRCMPPSPAPTKHTQARIQNIVRNTVRSRCIRFSMLIESYAFMTNENMIPVWCSFAVAGQLLCARTCVCIIMCAMETI